MIKFILYVIILVILFKVLVIVFNNLTYDVKYAIKEKEIKKQEELKQQIEKYKEEIKRQEYFRRMFPEISKYSKDKQIQEEIKIQEELRKKGTNPTEFIEKIREEIIQEELRQEEMKRQEKLEAQRIKLKRNISYIDRLNDGYEFEEYIANLLKSLGYTNVNVTPSSGDYGADVLAEKNGITYAIQCKWSSLGNNNIGNKAVQEIFSGKVFYNKDKRNSCNKQLLYAIGRRISKKTRYYIMG